MTKRTIGELCHDNEEMWDRIEHELQKEATQENGGLYEEKDDITGYISY